MADRFSLEKFEHEIDTKPYYPLASYVSSIIGYFGSEIFLQHEPENASLLEPYIGIDEQILRHQGSDFFGAAVYTYAFGNYVTQAALEAADIVGMYKTVNFIEKNYRLLRSAFTFTELGLYELVQAGGDFSKLDLTDMAAYGLGIVTLCHGRDIAHLFKETIFSFSGNEKIAFADQKQIQNLSL